MMSFVKNEKGITLIELLGVFVISGILITVIFSFFSFGTNVFQKEEAMVGLQNNANHIMTAITVAYYSNDEFQLVYGDENGDGQEDIVLNGTILSDNKLQYSLLPESITSNERPSELELSVINPSSPSEQITLKTYLRSVKNHADTTKP